MPGPGNKDHGPVDQKGISREVLARMIDGIVGVDPRSGSFVLVALRSCLGVRIHGDATSGRRCIG